MGGSPPTADMAALHRRLTWWLSADGDMAALHRRLTRRLSADG
jgi:hypothetical protein